MLPSQGSDPGSSPGGRIFFPRKEIDSKTLNKSKDTNEEKNY